MLILYGRLVFLAVSPEIDGIDMAHFARQRNTANIRLPAQRGNIYDVNGLNLATSVSSYTVIAFIDESRTTNPNRPHHVVDKQKTAEILAPILDMEVDYIYRLLNRRGYQVELGPGGRDITETTRREIAALNLPGISFIKKPDRHYPNGDFASYIIGYVRRFEEVVENDGLRRINYNIVGELGIESRYNELLSGEDGQLIYQRDRFGNRIPETPQTRVPAVDGHDIYLTIDSGVQRFLESAVKDVARTYQPEWIQISVLEAKTGRILGSATTPSYDPNRLNIVNYENPLTSFPFEPGSTMKTFTYMCAMEHGLYNENSLIQSGKMQIYDRTISDWRSEGWGRITFDEGFKYSSNVVAANLVKNLKPYELYDCFHRYGFGQKTEIELPREFSGSLPFVNQVEKANAAFGQGLSTTAIQHLQGLTMIANDGYKIKPAIIDRIYDPNLKEDVYQHEVEKTKVVEQAIADKMKQLLYSVVHEEGGTGHLYRNNSFDIIGKTGTAQIFNPATGQYLFGEHNYIYSFAGMFPYEDPEIIIYAAMKKPTHSRHLGMLYAVDEIIENIGKYFNIGFDKKPKEELNFYQTENYVNQLTVDVKEVYQEKNVELIVIGNGDRIIKQFPENDTLLLPNDKLFLVTNGDEIKMADVIGWSRKHLMLYLSIIDVDYEIEGYGFVKTQSISPDTLLDEETILKFTLEANNFSQ